MTSIKYEPLTTGNKVAQYKGYSIVVGRTEEGDWLAETKRRIDNGISVTYTPETNHQRHFYDYNKTRKSAVEMVMYLIDEFGRVSD